MPLLINLRGRTVSVTEEMTPGLLARGFTPAPEDDAPSFDTYTLAQLREYASENNINLGDATRKADVLAIIRSP